MIRKTKLQDNLWGYLFVLSQMSGFVLFALIPILVAFVLMFSDWNFLQPMEYVGLENFRIVFDDNYDLLQHSLINTSTFTAFIVPLTLIFGLFIAILLKQPSRMNNAYKTTLFLPFVTASAAISLVWYWLLAPGVGLINTVLAFIGISGPEWLRDPFWAKVAVVMYITWQNLGYAYLIFGAGLANIPSVLYEAARMDGASRWKEFRYITLPLISPVSFFLMVTLMISTFRLFGEVFVLTGGTGGPVYSTYTLVLYIYSLAFSFFRMGEASIVSWILILILFLLTFLNFRFSKRWVHYLE